MSLNYLSENQSSIVPCSNNKWKIVTYCYVKLSLRNRLRKTKRKMTSTMLNKFVCILILVVSIAKSLPVEDKETENIVEKSGNELLNITNTRIGIA